MWKHVKAKPLISPDRFVHSWTCWIRGIWHRKSVFVRNSLRHSAFCISQSWIQLFGFRRPCKTTRTSEPCRDLPFSARTRQHLGWVLAARWGVVRCYGQLSHDHRGLSRALARDRQAPLQRASGGKQSRDPPCWFIRIQSHLAEGWSCHRPFFFFFVSAGTQRCYSAHLWSCTVFGPDNAPGCMGKFTEHDMWHALIQNCVAVAGQRSAEGGGFLGKLLEHQESSGPTHFFSRARLSLINLKFLRAK